MVLMTGDRSAHTNKPVDFEWRGRYGMGYTKIMMDDNCNWQEIDEDDLDSMLTARDKKIIKVVKEKKECSPRDVADELGFTKDTDRQNIQKCMMKLVNNQFLGRVKSGVYAIAPF